MRSINVFDNREKLSEEAAYESAKQAAVWQWRRLLGAMFFVFMCLLVACLALVQLARSTL
jgi:flagellar biogenesis protein FliO